MKLFIVLILNLNLLITLSSGAIYSSLRGCPFGGPNGGPYNGPYGGLQCPPRRPSAKSLAAEKLSRCRQEFSEDPIEVEICLKGTINLHVFLKNRDLEALRIRFESRTNRTTPRQERLREFQNFFTRQSRRKQRPVLSFLTELRGTINKRLESRSLWSLDEIQLMNVDLQTYRCLKEDPRVDSMQPERIYSIIQAKTSSGGTTTAQLFSTASEIPTSARWGVGGVRAEDVWARGTRGRGVIVANIDTGVRRTHEALRDNWRAEHGWFDPLNGTTVPFDPVGHGTQTMGIMVGKTQNIGIAPDAQWIACRACNEKGCSSLFLRLCGEWMICPTRPDGTGSDCQMTPHIVSNSWGSGAGDVVYDDILRNWSLLGINSVFAIGNLGPGCGTASSPGDSDLALSVGAVDQSNLVASFSSRGVSFRGQSKPDVAAPGVNILSASNTADDVYALSNGTSLAAPMVAGVIALLRSTAHQLTVAEVKQAVISGTIPHFATGSICNGTVDRVYPNNEVGHGRVIAPLVMEAGFRILNHL